MDGGGVQVKPPEMPGMHHPSNFSRKIKICSSILLLVRDQLANHYFKCGSILHLLTTCSRPPPFESRLRVDACFSTSCEVAHRCGPGDRDRARIDAFHRPSFCCASASFLTGLKTQGQQPKQVYLAGFYLKNRGRFKPSKKYIVRITRLAEIYRTCS